MAISDQDLFGAMAPFDPRVQVVSHRGDWIGAWSLRIDGPPPPPGSKLYDVIRSDGSVRYSMVMESYDPEQRIMVVRQRYVDAA